MEEIVKMIGIIVLVLIVAFGLSLLFAYPIMWLWNWLMPMIFGLPIINFWQAFGLNLLSSLLLKSPNYNLNKK